MTTKPPTLHEIYELVRSFYNINSRHDFTHTRKRRFIKARQVAWYLARQHTDYSMEEIGESLDYHYTTVVNGCKKVREQLEWDEELEAQVDELEQELGDVKVNNNE